MRRWVGPRIEDREESSEERRGQVERSKGPAKRRNSDSEGFEGPWTEEGSKHRVSHAISHRQPVLVGVGIRAVAAG